MLKIPTVDDWYALSLKYRQFHHVNNTVLKDYGYMEIMDYLDSHDAKNILEFGHGFNPALFERYGKTRNVWGVDDYQGLAYFHTPDRDAWEKRFELGRELINAPSGGLLESALEPRAALSRRSWHFRNVP